MEKYRSKHKNPSSKHRRRSRSRSRSSSYERKRHHKSKHSRPSPQRHKPSRYNSDSSPERRVKKKPHHRSREREDRGRYSEEDDRQGRRDRDTREHYNKQRKKNHRQRQEEGEDNFSYGKQSQEETEPGEPVDKDKPNFEVSGKLAEETNTYKGVVIKYSEPPEARKPKKRWRLYPFKGEEMMKIMHIHRQSAYLLGRDRRVADIPIDHPSCSKQHAVVQFRLVNYTRDNGTEGRRVRPYIIDLGAANGTYVNNERIEAQRYVELLEKDVLKFGFSTREYVMLTDKADTTEVEEPVEEGDEDIDD